MIVNHEVRDLPTGFHHRLVAPGKAQGVWMTYHQPACLRIKNVGTFVCCTDYWKNMDPFPVPGQIYLVKEKTG